MIIDESKKREVRSNPYMYMSAGLSLNDKDRNLNPDLMEIQRFFKPIDNLFGDYETRKKFGLHNLLYRSSFFENLDKNDFQRTEFKISVEEINSHRGPKDLLIFYIIYDFSNSDTYIEYDWITSDTIIGNNDAWQIYFRNLKKGVENRFAKIAQIYLLDPEKLVHLVNLDNARLQAFKSIILDNFFVDKINKPESSILFPMIDEVVSGVKKCLKEKGQTNQSTSIEDITEGEIATILNQLKEEDSKQISEIIKRTCKRGLKMIGIESDSSINTDRIVYEYLIRSFISKKYKLKNFEKFEKIRVRIGYENNHYVLFLHPYDSESNNPVRIPVD